MDKKRYISVHFDYDIDNIAEDFGLIISKSNLQKLKKEDVEVSSAVWEEADEHLRRILIDCFDAKRA